MRVYVPQNVSKRVQFAWVVRAVVWVCAVAIAACQRPDASTATSTAASTDTAAATSAVDAAGRAAVDAFPADDATFDAAPADAVTGDLQGGPTSPTDATDPTAAEPIALAGNSPAVWQGQWTPWSVLPPDLTLQLGTPPVKPGWKGPVYPHYSAAQINDFTGDGVADLLLFTQGGDARLVVGPVSPQSQVVAWKPKSGVDPRIHSAALWVRPNGQRWAVLAGTRLAAWRWDGAQWQDEGDQFGLPEMGSQARYCSIPADMDNDGLLDLLECRYNCEPPAAHHVWLDRGDGKLVDRALEMGFTAAGPQWGVGLTDLSGDGLLDLVWMHDGCNNPKNTQAFYQQFGRDEAGLPQFARVAPHPLFDFPVSTMPYASPMGMDSADFDGDGRDDLAIGNVGLGMSLTTAMKYLMTEDESVPKLGQNLLLAQPKPGVYVDVGEAAGLKALVDPVKKLDVVVWGVRALDFDRDGWMDLAMSAAPDHEAYTAGSRGPMRPILLRNRGNAKFDEVSVQAGLPSAELAITMATGDLDNDGDDDVVFGQLAGQPIVLRNDLVTPHHYLRFRLLGRTSNVLGIGARITVQAGNVVRSRVHGVDAPLATQAERTTSFGVGAATSVAVQIRWPSGYVQDLGMVAVDQTLTVEEPTLVSVSARLLQIGKVADVTVQLRTPKGEPLAQTPTIEMVPPDALQWVVPPTCDNAGQCSGKVKAKQVGTTYLHVSAPGLDLQVWPKITSLP